MNEKIVELCICQNSQLWTNIITIISTIIIALIAGLVALYQVKSNVVSRSRILWIENLRDAISSYSAEIANCSTIIANGALLYKNTTDEAKKSQILLDFYPDYIKSGNTLNKLGDKIFLYLNSNEKNHKEIEKIIYTVGDLLHQEKTHFDKLTKINTEALLSGLANMIEISKLIFKEEWKKSKKLFTYK